jgi:hypothetical protein
MSQENNWHIIFDVTDTGSGTNTACRWMCFSFSATMIKWHVSQISDEVSITMM